MSELANLLRPLATRIANLFARGRVRSVNAAGKMQVLQLDLLAGETKDRLEHMEPYGFTSHPKAGAEAAAAFLDGDRSHGIVLVVADRRYRLTDLAEGEVAISDDLGQKVHITRDGIVIQSALKVRVAAADIELHASHSYSWDVNGYGERWTHTGGVNYEHKTWQTGAVVTAVPLPIHPPEGP